MSIRVWLGLTIALCMFTACAVTPMPASTPLLATIPVPTQTVFPVTSPIPTRTAAMTPTPILIITSSPVISPISTPTPIVSTPLPFPGLLAKPTGDHYPPPSVPGCVGMQVLGEPVKFNWDRTVHINGIMNVPEPQWTYYRCAQSRVELVAFYRQWMSKSPYSWLEYDAEERTEGTMIVYNNSPVSLIHTYRWLYLWFFPEQSNTIVSNLVAAWWDPPHNC